MSTPEPLWKKLRTSGPSRRTDREVADPRQCRRVGLAISSNGTTGTYTPPLELYFAKVFFPTGNRTAQLLSAAAVFAVGFIMRPIGSCLMGIYADRAGRKAALVMSMPAMGAGSLMIALTPGHDRIGVLAPVILIVAPCGAGPQRRRRVCRLRDLS